MNSTETTTKHLMLDLDETLICNSPMFTSLHRIHVSIKDDKGRVAKSLPNLVIRPHLIEFLEAMQKHYDLNIFTASDHFYAEAILCRVGIRSYFSNVYTREDCSYVDGAYFKDLSKLPFSASNTILIDDMTHHISNQSGQVLLIPAFFGDSFDRELEKLIPFLVELSKCSDLRPVSWKHIHFLERGCISKTSRKESFQKQSSLNPKNRKNRSGFKDLKRSVESENEGRKPRKTFMRSHSVQNKESLKFKIQNTQNPVPSGLLVKYQIALKESTTDTTQTKKTKEEANYDSDSSEECNLELEDERPPSDNPTVILHLGSKKLKLAFF